MKSGLQWDKWQWTAAVTRCEWSWWMIHSALLRTLCLNKLKTFQECKTTIVFERVFSGDCFWGPREHGQWAMAMIIHCCCCFTVMVMVVTSEPCFWRNCRILVSCFWGWRKGGIAGIIGGGGKTWHWPMASPKLHPVPSCPWAPSNLFPSVLAWAKFLQTDKTSFLFFRPTLC